MNLFRSKNVDLDNKLESYDTLIKEMEKQLGDYVNRVTELETIVKDLTQSIQSKDEELTETKEELEQKETIIEKQDEIIESVIDNAQTVEKLASVKALEILGDVGTDIVETVDSPEEIDILSQFKQLKGADLVEFYNKNKPNLPRMFAKALK